MRNKKYLEETVKGETKEDHRWNKNQQRKQGAVREPGWAG